LTVSPRRHLLYDQSGDESTRFHGDFISWAAFLRAGRGLREPRSGIIGSSIEAICEEFMGSRASNKPSRIAPTGLAFFLAGVLMLTPAANRAEPVDTPGKGGLKALVAEYANPSFDNAGLPAAGRQ